MTEPTTLMAILSISGAVIGAVPSTIAALAAYRRASVAARNSEHAAEQAERTNEQSRANAARLLEVANRTDGNLARLISAKDEAAENRAALAYQKGIRAANTHKRRITDCDDEETK